MLKHIYRIYKLIFLPRYIPKIIIDAFDTSVDRFVFDGCDEGGIAGEEYHFIVHQPERGAEFYFLGHLADLDVLNLEFLRFDVSESAEGDQRSGQDLFFGFLHGEEFADFVIEYLRVVTFARSVYSVDDGFLVAFGNDFVDEILDIGFGVESFREREMGIGAVESGEQRT